MFGIDADALGRFAASAITGEAAGKLVLAAATGSVIGLLTWVGQRLNKRDAAQAPTPPAAMGFVLDGDTAMALLNTAKAIRDDLEQWRREDVAQGKLDEAHEEIRELKAQLATASGTTHANQGDIRADIDELKRMMAQIKMH